MGLTFEILEIKKKLLKVNCTNRCRKMFLLEKTFVFIEIRVTKSNKNCQFKKNNCSIQTMENSCEHLTKEVVSRERD